MRGMTKNIEEKVVKTVKKNIKDIVDKFYFLEGDRLYILPISGRITEKAIIKAFGDENVEITREDKFIVVKWDFTEYLAEADDWNSLETSILSEIPGVFIYGLTYFKESDWCIETLKLGMVANGSYYTIERDYYEDDEGEEIINYNKYSFGEIPEKLKQLIKIIIENLETDSKEQAINNITNEIEKQL